MKVMSAAALLSLLAASPSKAQAPAQTQPAASATLARDVNGLELGMNISEVRRRMRLEHLASETFSGSENGVHYDFGFTPLGSLFRIQSRQLLRSFEPTLEFARELGARLSQKYGPPLEDGLPRGPASWELVEAVTNATGQRLPFTTMRFTVMLSNEGESVSLEMTMLDFRVLWTDQQSLNQAPTQRATDAIRF